MKNEILPEILSFERWVAVIDRIEEIFLRRLKRSRAAQADFIASEWSGEVANIFAHRLYSLGRDVGSRTFEPSEHMRLFVRVVYVPSSERLVYECESETGRKEFTGAVSAGFTRVLHVALTRGYLLPNDLILLNSMTPDHPRSERARFMTLAKRAEAQAERET